MDMNLIIASIAVFLGIILILVVILLVAKKYLSPSGNVNITINGKDTLSVPQGASLLSTFPAHAVARVLAASARCRCLWAVVRFWIPKRAISPVSR